MATPPTARVVHDWVAAHPDLIELHFLPGYSPAEMLNHDVKTNALGRRRPIDVNQLKADVRGPRSRQRQPARVARYFLERHLTYAAAPTI